MAPPVRRWRPDREELRRLCEDEGKSIPELMEQWNLPPKDRYLYYLCQQWGITPTERTSKYDDRRAKELTPTQYQVLLGTLLGDGHCTINRQRRQVEAVLSLAQGERQKDYLEWKVDYLRDFFPQKEAYGYVQAKWTTRKKFIYRSITHPAFTTLYHLFYTDGKKHMTRTILDRLEPLGLAVWLMDDGSWTSGGIAIATHSFPKAESEMAAEWFTQRWGVTPSVKYHKTVDQWFLHFGGGEARRLRQIVRPHFFAPLLYKLALTSSQGQPLQPPLIPSQGASYGVAPDSIRTSQF